MFLLTVLGGLSTLLREHRARRERKQIPMFTHAEVWRGIDRLAKQNGMTPSGLARRAGLDPTTFNPSKRVTKQSKSRWPSTESLAKILTATGTSFADFVSIMSDEAAKDARPASQRLRSIPLDQASASGLFDDAGFPVGDGWDEIDFPNLDDAHAYALEVRGDALLPAYRDGDLLVISPAAQVRRQDRVVLRARSGETVAGVLVRRTAQRIELDPFEDHQPSKVLAVREIAWLGRIVWVSQ
jgi:phage repressor protein C with HTH and peptisase S24 domain